MRLNSPRRLSSTFVAICCFSALNISTGYTAEEGIEERTRTIGKQLTAIKLIETAIQELGINPIDRNALKTEMLKNPSEYRQGSKSKKPLGEWYKKHLWIHLDDELSRIYRLKLVSKEWLEKRVNSQFKKIISSSIARVVSSNEFTKELQNSRAVAVEEQWRDVTVGIYPRPDAVESVIENGVKAKKRIEKKLKNYMSNKIEVLFEENERDVEEEIERVINHALSQYRSQKNLVNTYKAEGNFTEKTIFKVLVDKLNEHIKKQKQKAKDNEIIYDAFTSLVERAASRAVELETEKFRVYISSDELSSLIDEGRLRRLIEENVEKYRTFSRCFNELQEQLIPGIKAEIVLRYSTKAGAVRNAGFRKKLKRLLAEDLRIVTHDKIKENLKGPVKRIRNQLATRQLKEHFGQIVSKEWEVPESHIIRFKDKGDEISASELVRLLGLGKIREIKLLEEAEEELDRLATQLLEEGNRALLRQEGIVQDLKDEVQDTLQEEIRDNLNHNTLSASKLYELYKDRAIELYVSCVEDRWRKRRKELIWSGQERMPYMEKKYEGLFKNTRNEIEQIITTGFFEELELHEESNKPQELPKKEHMGGEASKKSGVSGGSLSTDPGDIQGSGFGSAIASFAKKAIPWLLIIIFVLVFLALLYILIRWLIKKRQEKEQPEQLLGKGKIIFVIENTNFRREFEYPKGEADSENVKIAFKTVWESLKL